MNFTDQLNLTNVSLATIGIGLVAAAWSRLKIVGWRILSLGVSRMIVEYQASAALGFWIWRNGRRGRFGERFFGGSGEFIRTQERRLVVGWEQVGNDTAIFWFGWKPMLVSLTCAAYSANQVSAPRLTVTYLRGLFNPERLIQAAIDEWNLRHQHAGTDGHWKRFAVHRILGTGRRVSMGDPGKESTRGAMATPAENGNITEGRRYIGYTEDEIGRPVPEDPMGYLAFPPAISSLIESIRRWLKDETWYKSRSIPWRMGVGLVGPPGNGKSSFAKGMAQACDLPIFALELATFADSDMTEAWSRALENSPCMVLVEDFDTVFHGRDNITEGDNGLSFGCFLNCLSGVGGADGILTVITTNHPETLDPALGAIDERGRSSRPGRIDRIVVLQAPDENCRRKIAARILSECPEQIEETVAAGCGESGAQFTERCCQIALQDYWKKLKTREVLGTMQ